MHVYAHASQVIRRRDGLDFQDHVYLHVYCEGTRKPASPDAAFELVSTHFGGLHWCAISRGGTDRSEGRQLPVHPQHMSRFGVNLTTH